MISILLKIIEHRHISSIPCISNKEVRNPYRGGENTLKPKEMNWKPTEKFQDFTPIKCTICKLNMGDKNTLPSILLTPHQSHSTWRK